MGLAQSSQRPGVVGPLFWYEVARHTRRGHGTLLRCLFVLLLLVPAYYAYVSRVGIEAVNFRDISFAPILVSPDYEVVKAIQTRMAQTFFRWSMICQAMAILLITPSYVATAIAEEKQVGTIELLFTTFMTSREIILGKMFSRLLHLAAFLLAGLPVVCLTLFWDGPTFGEILRGYVLLLATLFCVGCIGIFCSVTARTVLGAELASYGLTIVISLLVLGFGWRAGYPEISSAIGIFYVWFSPEHLERQAYVQEYLIAYPLLYGAIGFIFLDKAVTTLRPICLSAADRTHRQPGSIVPVRHRSKVKKPMAILVEAYPQAEESRVVEWKDKTERSLVKQPPEPEKKDEQRPEVVAVDTTMTSGEYQRTYTLLPMSDQPLLWKEMHHGTTVANPGALRKLRYLLLVFVALVAVLSGILYWTPVVVQQRDLLAERGPSDAWKKPRSLLNFSLRVVAVLAMTGWCAAVGLRTANTLSQERARQTLMGLLTLPVERREILRAKALGSLLRYQWLGWVALSVWVAGLFTGLIHPLVAPLLPLVFACHLGFIASFGIWLSLTVRSQLSVQLCMSLVVMSMCAAPLIIALYAPDEAAEITRNTFWHRFEDVGASPINVWWFFMSGRRPFDRIFWVTILSIVTGLAIYVGASWAFWKGACLQFDRIQGDETTGRK
jgi:ABC-type transport system involved in multi-copper enzyme maturation permease subunit